MQGAIWVMFTQTLICNDKVNDGRLLRDRDQLPEGSVANLGDAEGSTGDRLGVPAAGLHRLPADAFAALQARGFIEEVIGAYWSTPRPGSPFPDTE